VKKNVLVEEKENETGRERRERPRRDSVFNSIGPEHGVVDGSFPALWDSQGERRGPDKLLRGAGHAEAPGRSSRIRWPKL
jgi:hypothetical protein